MTEIEYDSEWRDAKKRMSPKLVILAQIYMDSYNRLRGWDRWPTVVTTTTARASDDTEIRRRLACP